MGYGVIGLAVAAAIGVGMTPPPSITDVRPVTVHSGVNVVPGFLLGGGTATIIEARRGNGNAHGHHSWMVLGGASEGNSVGLVGIDGGERIVDVVSDNPFDGERVLGAVRFAQARVAGQTASLMIRADLDDPTSHIPADHATVTVRWFLLDHDAAAVGRPTDVFHQIGAVRTTKLYCNAALALRDVAAVPLPVGFAAANSSDGCVAG